jgi:hypothetical protein
MHKYQLPYIWSGNLLYPPSTGNTRKVGNGATGDSSMRLAEWEDKHHCKCQDFNQPGYERFKTVANTVTSAQRQELFRLDDYIVTSVEGGAIWLQEKQIAQTGYYAVIRHTEGKNWIDVGTLAASAEEAKASAEATDKKLPDWAKVNRILSVRKVKIITLPDNP